MKVAVFSTKRWVRESFDDANEDHGFELSYFEARLNAETAPLAEGHEVVCAFVNDVVDAPTIDILHEKGVGMIALRAAGFNNVDLKRAAEHKMCVTRVPAYSPYAVAEHALGLILSLNRKIHRAFNRVREGNFMLDGLMGFDLHGKTVGVIGTGKIGRVFGNMMRGMGCEVIAYDKYPSEEFAANGVRYVDLQELYAQSDIISLHCPLTHETYHIINDYAIRSMKRGVILINISRGPLIDSESVIDGIKQGIIEYVGLDVYEEESDLFFEDLSEQIIADDTFVRLRNLPNVIVTSHQGFFTREAVQNIAAVTFGNIADYQVGEGCHNAVPGLD